MKNWTLYWAPTGAPFAVVQARTRAAAVRKAPLPQRRHLGEIYAVEGNDTAVGWYFVDRRGESRGPFKTEAERDAARDNDMVTS